MTSGEPRIRRARREHGWTTINNAPAVDPALSWEAVGVLTYLLTKPDDWEVLTAHLVKFRKGGRDRMRRIMGELRAAGYMKLVRERDAGGRILDTFYEIADLPELLAHRPTENPADGGTESLESRPTANPSAGKHDPLLSTDPVPSTEDHQENIAASTDDAPPAGDPSPPESLVAAGSANPNGTASQAEPNGTGKPKSRKSSAPPAPLGPGSLVYRDVIHLTPNHAQREILDAAHAAHGEAAMRAVMVAWMAHGYSPKNVAGMVDAINAGGLRANGHSGAGSRANGKPLSAMVLEI